MHTNPATLEHFAGKLSVDGIQLLNCKRALWFPRFHLQKLDNDLLQAGNHPIIQSMRPMPYRLGGEPDLCASDARIHF